MIFNRDLLFVHVPKAGGMALTKHLLVVLPRPIYYSVPEGHSNVADPGVVHIPGIRHENLAEAREVVARHGFNITRFPLILAAVRNPYALEVSRYAYLQKGHPWDRGRNQRLALEEDFERFAVESCDHAGPTRPIQSYFELDGRIPPNLRVLRTEQLGEDLRDALAQSRIATDGPLARENESSHGGWERYYTRAAEEAVYNRYRWLFDRGFYRRLDRDAFPFVAESPIAGPRIPVGGPVRQVGIASGFWRDGWMGECARFRIRAEQAVATLDIVGRAPNSFVDGNELSVSVGGSECRWKLDGQSGEFRFEAPIAIEPGVSVEVRLASSRTFCPQAVGLNQDDRSLSVVIDRIRFRPPSESHSGVAAAQMSAPLLGVK